MMPVESARIQPPDELEERVVARLHEAGLLNRNFTAEETSMKAIHLSWAFAATLLLAIGVWAGTWVPQEGDTATSDSRPVFALMLYEDSRYQAPAAGMHAERVAEYSAWAGDLARQGLLVDGAELSGKGVMLHRDRPRAETVPSGADGVLAGYFVIRASSLEEAERIAAECPHLRYGGTVSVRAAVA